MPTSPDDMILKKALEERERCYDEAKKWDDFIERYTKVSKSISAPAMYESTSSPQLNLAKHMPMSQPTMAEIRNWAINQAKEKGYVYISEVKQNFPTVPSSTISTTLYRSKGSLRFDSVNKKWLLGKQFNQLEGL